MKYRDYKVEVLKYLISYFRQNKDIKNILIAIGLRFNELQDVISDLLDSLTISKARGFLLDNIGTEVGTTRDEVDYGDYFCVNLLHVNVPKRFYFLTSNLNPDMIITLEDKEFIQKIMAVIGGNLSSGTRNENLNIIKMITNADKVVIKQPYIFNKDAFTVVGSPTIVDGVASGFGGSNYLIKSLTFPSINKRLDITTPVINISNTYLSQENIFEIYNNTGSNDCCFIRRNSATNLQIYFRASASWVTKDLTIQQGNNYQIRYVWDGSTYYIYTKTNNTDWTLEISFDDSSVSDRWGNCTIYLGFYENKPFGGSIDLKQFSITVDDKIVYNGSKKDKCKLDLYLTGTDITYTKNTFEYISNILTDGVFLNEVHINE